MEEEDSEFVQNALPSSLPQYSKVVFYKVHYIIYKAHSHFR